MPVDESRMVMEWIEATIRLCLNNLPVSSQSYNQSHARQRVKDCLENALTHTYLYISDRKRNNG